MGTSPYKPESYKKWYDGNKQTQYERVRARKVAMRQWLDEYKSRLCCERCPEDHPVCLDFHHRDPLTKEMGIGEAVMRGWSKERIMAEIAKCDVLCANCHRKEHASLAQSGRALAL